MLLTWRGIILRRIFSCCFIIIFQKFNFTNMYRTRTCKELAKHSSNLIIPQPKAFHALPFRKGSQNCLMWPTTPALAHYTPYSWLTGLLLALSILPSGSSWNPIVLLPAQWLIILWNLALKIPLSPDRMNCLLLLTNDFRRACIHSSKIFSLRYSVHTECTLFASFFMGHS